MRKLKVFSLLVVLILTFSAAAFAEDDDVATFECELTNALEMSDATEAMESTETCAMVTVCMALDLALKDIAMPSLSSSTYIGVSDGTLCFYFHSDEQDIIVAYIPEIGEASYMLMDSVSDDAVELAFDELCPDGYVKNDVETLYNILDALQSLLAE